jgi:micrococcal nuclease
MSKKIYILPFVFFLLSFFFFSKTFVSGNIVTESSSQPAVLGASESSAQAQKTYTVTRVIDGDTIEVTRDNKTDKVRYIGVDTPETVDPHRPDGCFGKEASDENKKILTGHEVILEKDVSETDKFGRLLRYVYLKLDDGSFLFVNDYMAREGFAKASTFPPDVKFASRFSEAQSEAQKAQIGLWSPNTCSGITSGAK